MAPLSKMYRELAVNCICIGLLAVVSSRCSSDDTLMGPVAIFTSAGRTTEGDLIAREFCRERFEDEENEPGNTLREDGYEASDTRFFGSTPDYDFRDLFTDSAGLGLEDPATVAVHFYNNSGSVVTETSLFAENLLTIDDANGSFTNSDMQNLMQGDINASLGGSTGTFFSFTTITGEYDSTNNCTDGTESSGNGSVGQSSGNASIGGSTSSCADGTGVICIVARKMASGSE